MELILRTNTKDYYKAIKEGKEVFVSVFKFGKEKTIETLTEGVKNGVLPGYMKDVYTFESLLNEPLNNLFSLEIYKNAVLQPLNFNLFEYELLIKGNKNPNVALKCACINKDREGDYFYIACEPYDTDITKETRSIINSYIFNHRQELENIMKCNYTHTEYY